MKKKSLLVVLMFLLVFVSGCTKKDETNNKKIEKQRPNYGEIVSVDYSFSESYGTAASTATRYFKITPDGKIFISNAFDDSTLTLDIGIEKYNELTKYIYDRIEVFDEEIKDDVNVLDGSSSGIGITFDSGESKRISGYMVTNKKFNQIEGKIYKLIDGDKYREYVTTLSNKRTND